MRVPLHCFRLAPLAENATASGRLPTLRLPTRLGVQFKLIRFYYAQRRAGRPRSSPSPLRGELMWYNEDVALRYDILPFQGVDTTH
jgi:hypothetical protein